MTSEARLAAKRDFLTGAEDLVLVPSVHCEDCGACCMHMGYPPFVGMFEGEHLAQSDPEWLALRDSHPHLAAKCRQGAIDGRGDDELPCLWLDAQTGRCRHYEHRPSVCREFEKGSEECLDHRLRRGIV